MPPLLPNPQDLVVLPSGPDLQGLLPIVAVPLTEDERSEASRFQNALHILGPAAGACLVCPGNQVGLEEAHRCAYSAKCVLLKAHKAPQGEICPIESEYIVSRFQSWAQELKKEPLSLSASERSFVSELVWLDLQEQRCSAIVSKGSAARLSQLNVKEAHPDTLQPITWERVLHVNVALMESISIRRRMLLREWMISPDQKARQARWENKGRDTDQSSMQAAVAARLKKLRAALPEESI